MYLIFSSLNVYGMEFTTVKGEKNPWVMRSFVDSSVFLIVATVHLVQCLIHIFNVFVVLELTELAVTIG